MAMPMCWPAPKAPALAADGGRSGGNRWRYAAPTRGRDAPRLVAGNDSRVPVWEALHQLIRALNQDGETAAGTLLARMSLNAAAVIFAHNHTDAEGIANMQLPAAGSWVIRSGHHIDEADARSACYEASASLLLTIN